MECTPSSERHHLLATLSNIEIRNALCTLLRTRVMHSRSIYTEHVAGGLEDSTEQNAHVSGFPQFQPSLGGAGMVVITVFSLHARYDVSLQALTGSACSRCTAGLIYDQNVTAPTRMHRMFII